MAIHTNVIFQKLEFYLKHLNNLNKTKFTSASEFVYTYHANEELSYEERLDLIADEILSTLPDLNIPAKTKDIPYLIGDAFCYRNTDGSPLFYTDSYGNYFHTSDNEWVSGCVPSPYPIYGLERLSKDKITVIVDSPKTSDKLNNLAGDVFAFLSWYGSNLKELDLNALEIHVLTTAKDPIILSDNTLRSSNICSDLHKILSEIFNTNLLLNSTTSLSKLQSKQDIVTILTQASFTNKLDETIDETIDNSSLVVYQPYEKTFSEVYPKFDAKFTKQPLSEQFQTKQLPTHSKQTPTKPTHIQLPIKNNNSVVETKNSFAEIRSRILSQQKQEQEQTTITSVNTVGECSHVDDTIVMVHNDNNNLQVNRQGDRLKTKSQLKLNQIEELQESEESEYYNIDFDAVPESESETEATDGVNIKKKALWKKLKLECNHRKVPYTNISNLIRVLDYLFTIRYDTYRDVVTVNGEQITENLVIKMTVRVQEEVGLYGVSVASVRDAAIATALTENNKINSCRDWMNSLVWDKTPRLDSMLTDIFNAADNNYTRSVSKCWLMSMVARVLNPGCQVDNVVVLEGQQGCGKSSALSILGGEWYVECFESITSKDFYSIIKGKMIVELGEMSSVKGRDIDKLKGIISCRKDSFRPAYGRLVESRDRQCVFVGTTNETDWHHDVTGGRRWWPVSCGKIDRDRLALERDQLFAEAVYRFKHGESWFDVAVEEQVREVEARAVHDEWEPIISEWLEKQKLNQVRISTILSDCILVGVSEQNRNLQLRVAKILKKIGWVNRVIRVTPTSTAKLWVRV